MTRYSTQSDYPDTKQISPCHTLRMPPPTRLGRNEDQLFVSYFCCTPPGIMPVTSHMRIQPATYSQLSHPGHSLSGNGDYLFTCMCAHTYICTYVHLEAREGAGFPGSCIGAWCYGCRVLPNQMLIRHLKISHLYLTNQSLPYSH